MRAALIANRLHALAAQIAEEAGLVGSSYNCATRQSFDHYRDGRVIETTQADKRKDG